ncbi:hypothetical protein OROGR_032389 [Orobanche gracilis]
MKLIKLPIISTLIFQALILFSSPAQSASNNSNLFREYIGAQFDNVAFSDVPINSRVQFDFILAFAIDYTNLSIASPTNGKFNIFWDSDTLTPPQVLSIKKKHPNVRVALSIGGDSVGNGSAYFDPESVESWLSNAVPSLTGIIREYHLDGIDIDYEHFKKDPGTFAECIGRLVTTLKKDGTISFASIAPYDDERVQKRYMALWKKYGHVIDYVNFQFYAYGKGTSVSQFMDYFAAQNLNYYGGRILVSFISDGSGGLDPGEEFFTACRRLDRRGNLHGIFVWCADDSKKMGFKYEKQSQDLLAVSH